MIEATGDGASVAIASEVSYDADALVLLMLGHDYIVSVVAAAVIDHENLKVANVDPIEIIAQGGDGLDDAALFVAGWDDERKFHFNCDPCALVMISA